MAILEDLLLRLTEKKQEVARTFGLPRPWLSGAVLNRLAARYAHETTAIAGNRLTLEETRAVVMHGATVAGRSLREHQEVRNVVRAWQWLECAVPARASLDEDSVRHLHRMLLAGLPGADAGHYRTVDVFIGGSTHRPPAPRQLPLRMAELLGRFRVPGPAEHVVSYAARAHAELAAIHPFLDGNGRLARMVVNLLLMGHGWPPAMYTAANRAQYVEGLELAESRGCSAAFSAVTARAVACTLDAVATMQGRGPGTSA